MRHPLRSGRTPVALATLVGVAFANGCGGGNDEATGPAAGKTAASGPPVIQMTDGLQFRPQRVEVKAGTRVVWRNVGSVAHTVTTLRGKAANPADVSVPQGAKAWDSGFIAGGESYARTFSVPGTYRYFCIPHEGARMVGTIVVSE
jgi:plastocyanin